MTDPPDFKESERGSKSQAGHETTSANDEAGHGIAETEAITSKHSRDACEPPKPDEHHPRHNFLVLSAYQIMMRVGWIFKTESIIMPAIMDILCGPGTALAAWLRSWLPQLNRFGQSIPQLLFANRIRHAPRKKYTVAVCSGLMGFAFLALSAIWYFNDGRPNTWMRVSFLILYAIFFICVGINNLGFNTLQGKLVRYNFRGRLFLFANSVGGIAAIVAAWWLLTSWLELGNRGIVYLFAFAGTCFLVGSLLALSCREQAQNANGTKTSHSILTIFHLPWQLFRTNQQFRWLALIAACFGISMALFPHYQALYRKAVAESQNQFTLNDLVIWVIIQNTGTVLISWCAGPAADRLGNRIVLQVVLFLIGLAPILSIGLSFSADLARNYYFIVFLLVGVTPVTIRVLNNFALELAPSDSHPQFLSALSLCIAFPVIVFSQFIGLLIPILGFMPLFFGISGIILVGWGMTFFVAEPRKRLTTDIEQNDNL